MMKNKNESPTDLLKVVKYYGLISAVLWTLACVGIMWHMMRQQAYLIESGGSLIQYHVVMDVSGHILLWLLGLTGIFFGTYQIGRRIREYRFADDALRESEERFRTIFETAIDSIFIKDKSLRYTQVNPAMEHLFKLPSSKLIGQTDEDLFGKETGSHLKEIDTRVLEGEIIEEEHTKPVNGVEMTFHVIKVPMKNSSGEIIGLCGIARDVTERNMMNAEREQLIDQMEERIKEMRCLYLVAELLGSRSTLEEIFNDVVTIIPYGFRHSLITRARIRIDDKEYVWQQFDETEWKLTSDLVVNGENRGCLEVFYIKEHPEMGDGPFLREEQELLTAIAKTLSKAIERITARDELKVKVRELEEFNRLSVERELRMIELKEEINQLLIKSGSESKYEIVS